jgi:hypothetical protein
MTRGEAARAPSEGFPRSSTGLTKPGRIDMQAIRAATEQVKQALPLARRYPEGLDDFD